MRQLECFGFGWEFKLLYTASLGLCFTVRRLTPLRNISKYPDCAFLASVLLPPHVAIILGRRFMGWQVSERCGTLPGKNTNRAIVFPPFVLSRNDPSGRQVEFFFFVFRR